MGKLVVLVLMMGVHTRFQEYATALRLLSCAACDPAGAAGAICTGRGPAPGAARSPGPLIRFEHSRRA